MTYIFASAEEKAEYERLKLIEQAFDQKTQTLLLESEITSGWRCLEVGAGAGSIVVWMSNLVGNTGRVVAVDKDIKFLALIEAEQIEKIAGDILELELASNYFDLIHARYVLIHIDRAAKVIQKLIKYLRPGGVLILEEPDFTAARVIKRNLPHEKAHQQVNEAIIKMFTDRGLDPAFGLKLPLLLQKNGVFVEQARGEQHLCHGNSPIATLMGSSAATLEKQYLQTQKASQKDIQIYIENSIKQEFWAVYYSTISVVGRKPEA